MPLWLLKTHQLHLAGEVRGAQCVAPKRKCSSAELCTTIMLAATAIFMTDLLDHCDRHNAVHNIK